jgi:adenine-specific DNA-methyltransferase
MVAPFSSKGLGVGGDASGEDTILTTWLADDGYQFDEKVEILSFENSKAYYVAGRVLYIIDSSWSQEATMKLLNRIGTHQLNVTMIVVYEYALGFTRLTELKTNVGQLREPEVKIEVRG